MKLSIDWILTDEWTETGGSARGMLVYHPENSVLAGVQTPEHRCGTVGAVQWLVLYLWKACETAALRQVMASLPCMQGAPLLYKAIHRLHIC